MADVDTDVDRTWYTEKARYTDVDDGAVMVFTPRPFRRRTTMDQVSSPWWFRPCKPHTKRVVLGVMLNCRKSFQQSVLGGCFGLPTKWYILYILGMIEPTD